MLMLKLTTMVRTQTLEFKILMKDGICFKEYIYYLLMVCEVTDLGFWSQTLDFGHRLWILDTDLGFFYLLILDFPAHE